ncbi:MAG: SEC-C metal-binding domain-containing protein [Pseudomonadota bacterium]
MPRTTWRSRQKVDGYAPCPCGSGKKYKWCCRGRAGRAHV